MQSHKVSIAVPSYNYNQLTERLIRSVLQQSYRNWELIVIDDASTDDTPEMLRKYAGIDDRVKIILKDHNEGMAKTFNQAFAECRGDYIIGMNADDHLAEDYTLERLAGYLDEHLDIGLAYADNWIIDRQGNKIKTFAKETCNRHTILKKNYIGTWSAIWRNEIFQKIGRQVEFDMCCDWDLWLKLADHCEIGHMLEPLFAWYPHTDSLYFRNRDQGILQEQRCIANAYRRRGLVNGRGAGDVIKVSVIIPCYKQAQYLPEAVESVLLQTFQNFEIIIVNDGSPDNTKEIAEQLIRKYPEHCIRLINQTNQGLSASRNNAIRQAAGQYILPLDADDMIKATFLDQAVRLLDARADLGIAYTHLEQFGTQHKVLYAEDYDFVRLCQKNQLNYCALYRRPVWEDAGGYNPNMKWGYEDWDFWIGAGATGWQAQLIAEPLFLYRVRNNTMFADAWEHDLDLKAQLVKNHPDLYSQETLEWARMYDRYVANPDDANINAQLSQFYQNRRHNWRLALPHLGRCYQGSHPDDPNYISYSGLAALVARKYDEAERCFARLIAQQPNPFGPHFYSAICKILIGQKPEAIRHLGQALRLKPGWGEPYGLLACLHLQEGRLDEARRLIENGLAYTSDQLLFQLLDLLVQNPQEAVDYIDDFLEALLDRQTKVESFSLLEARSDLVVEPKYSVDQAAPDIEQIPDSPPPRMVSVIIPTYNRPEMLVEAVRSVLAQTLQDFEIIVVNDGGIDVESTIASYNRRCNITYVRHYENLGPGAAKNSGLKLARGKYIAYLDDDDVYYADHLETLVAVLERTGGNVAYADAYQAHQVLENGTYKTVRKDIPYSKDFDADALLVANYIPTLCIVHARECLGKTGLFDERLRANEDFDLWIRMSRHYPFHHVKKTTAEFRTRRDGSSITGSRQGDFLRAGLYIYRKYRDYIKDKPEIANEQKRRSAHFRAQLIQIKAQERAMEQSQGGAMVAAHSATEAAPENAGIGEILATARARKQEGDFSAAIAILEQAKSLCEKGGTSSLPVPDRLEASATPCASLETLAHEVQKSPQSYAQGTLQWADLYIQYLRNPADAELNARLIQYYLNDRGNWTLALPHLKQHAALNASSAEVNLLLGVACLKNDDPAPAEAALQKAIDLQANDGDAHFYLGCSQLLQGKDESAIEHFEDAIELKPDWADPHVLLSCLHWAKGNDHNARRIMEQALSFLPNDPTLTQLAEEVKRQGPPAALPHMQTMLTKQLTQDPRPLPESRAGALPDGATPSASKPQSPEPVATPAVRSADPTHECMVSVIVPTYNRPDMLVESLRSILNQTYQDFEIIVINDAGSDVTEIINFLNKDNKITYVKHNRNRGRSAARNSGLRLARGKYVAYLDDDDIFYPPHLQTLVDFLETTQCKAAYVDAYRATQEWQHTAYQTTNRTLVYSYDFSLNMMLTLNFIPTLCIMHERACLDEAGLFDESLGVHEDWDLWIRIGLKYGMRHVKAITAEYRFRPDGSNSTSSNEMRRAFLDTADTIYQKYHAAIEDKPEVRQAQQGYRERLRQDVNEAEAKIMKQRPVPASSGPAIAPQGPVKASARKTETNGLTILLYCLEPLLYACPTLRLISPLTSAALKDRVKIVAGTSFRADGGSAKVDIDLAPIEDADIIVLQRQMPFAADSVDKIFERARALGKKVIYEVDDNVLSLPLEHPQHEYFAGLRDRIMKDAARADAVTVSTPELAKVFASYNSNTHVLPNCIDERLWSGDSAQPAKIDATSDKIIIGYMGTQTHDTDFEPVAPAIRSLLQKYDDKLVFRFWGHVPKQLVGVAGVETIGALDAYYYQFAQAFKAAHFDIALAPLADNELNRCKSNLKFLEYAVCRIPGIYSKVTPYATTVADGTTGLLVNNDPEAWAAAMIRLIENRNLRKAIAENAYQEVLAKHTTEKNAQRWLRLYSDLLDNKLAAPAPRKVSIIIPVYDKVGYTRQCLQALATNTAYANREVIVVDNGSTDGTKPFLAGLGDKIKVITNETNLGFAKACNQGARAATGDYLLFLNNDTIPQPGWLEELVKVADQDPQTGIVGCKLLYPNDTIQHAGVILHSQVKMPYHIYRQFPKDHPVVNRIREYPAVTAACLLIRRDLFFAVAGFDEAYINCYEDIDLCLKVREKGYRIMYTPQSVLYHYESVSEGRRDRERFLRSAQIFKKKWFDKIPADEARYYAEDEFKPASEDPYTVVPVPAGKIESLLTLARFDKNEGQYQAAIEKLEKAKRLFAEFQTCA